MKRALHSITLSGIATVFAIATPVSHAQSYPSKPIRVIVPYAAGGFSDISSRLLGATMSRVLGQQLVIEPKPGGGGRIGADMIAKAPADGYQILYTTSGTHTYMQITEKSLSYDPIKDFTPIALVGNYGLLTVINPSVPARTITEFIAYAKKNPGKLNYASSGLGSGIHFAGELLKDLAGINLLHVPYKGSGPALQDVIAGACQITFDGAAKPFIDAGKVRFLGTTSAQRDPRFPDTPTLQEAGVAGYDLTYWLAVFAPAGLAADIQTKLNAAVNATLADEKYRTQATEMGIVPMGGSPDVLAPLIRTETAKLRKIAIDAKLQFE
jgi:tripartite-type tricarboxylate transporter receptor subunit TctC